MTRPLVYVFYRWEFGRLYRYTYTEWQQVPQLNPVWVYEQQLLARQAQQQRAQERAQQARERWRQQHKKLPAAGPSVVPLTREASAAAKLKLAQALLDMQKRDDAAEYCVDLLARFPETKAAAEAQNLLKQLGQKASPAQAAQWQKEIERASQEASLGADEKKALGKVRRAQVLFESGKTADAKEYCQEILAKYPDTRAAADAQELLNKLGMKP